MLGTLRFILAFAVVIFHIAPGVAHFSGPVAVFGFYCISGFLVTRIADTTYRGRPVAFVANRALRIYPAYWVVAAASLLVVYFGTPVDSYMLPMRSVGDVLQQVVIFGLIRLDGSSYAPRLVPPAWSLSIELFWYVVMILLFSVVRNVKSAVTVWLAISVAIAIAEIAEGGPFTRAYFSYWGPSLAFASGAAIHAFGIKLPRWHLAPAFGCVVGLMVLANWLPPAAWVVYLAIFTTAYAVASSQVPFVEYRNIDRWLGDLAYPVFLCHFQVVSVIGNGKAGTRVLIESLPAIIVTAIVVVLVVERPVQKIREIVRAVPRGTAVTLPEVT